jgi:hypothetical protein
VLARDRSHPISVTKDRRIRHFAFELLETGVFFFQYLSYRTAHENPPKE